MAAAFRRLTAARYRRCVFAAGISISAIAVMFAVVDLDPVTSRLLFSASSPASVSADGSYAVEVNSDSGVLNLLAPPSESALVEPVEEQVDDEDELPKAAISQPVVQPPIIVSNMNPESKEINASGEYVEPTPSQSMELGIPSNEMSKAKENFLKSAGEDLRSPPSQPEKALLRSDADEMRSSNGNREILPLQPEKSVSMMTATDQELVFVKEEIARSPAIFDDPDLHTPLFRNVSVFKRSYELMERTLKVYIYRDGRRPILHAPFFKGIYASEGWFLKLMEANTQFVVKDPNKAHLFYLPYSAHKLEETLYKPDSHNLRPLAVFLKNYVDGISVKYPFWNRTRGADHFLVACHDWGPYTTKLHEELSKNTIKALCNADTSEGVFVRGKDVSLPETNIRNPRRPLHGIGGKPVSQRSILAFFAGNMHGRVRPTLLEYWDGKDEDIKIYGPLLPKVSRKMSYAEHMKSSKFCICPMGFEVNSPRIVEAIYYECVPVIIADNFVLPFDDVLDWSRFSVVVAEKDIPNLKDILAKISLREYVAMQSNVKRLQRHFLWHQRPVKYDIFHMILHSVWFNRLNQIQREF